jgi:hypothetical protein
LKGRKSPNFLFSGQPHFKQKIKNSTKKIFMMIFTLWTWKVCGCFKKIRRGGEMEEEVEEFTDDVWDPEAEEDEDLGF